MTVETATNKKKFQNDLRCFFYVYTLLKYINSISSQCARGKSFIARKVEIITISISCFVFFIALHWQVHYKFSKVISIYIYMYDEKLTKHFFSNNTLAINVIHQASPLAVGRIALVSFIMYCTPCKLK